MVIKDVGSEVMRFFSQHWRVILGLSGFAAAIGFLAVLLYAFSLNETVVAKFEGKRWAIPSRVYARPLELYPGMQIGVDALERELKLIGYQSAEDAFLPGTYAREQGRLTLNRRSFQHWDALDPSLTMTLRFKDDRLTEIKDAQTGEQYQLQRLEPVLIASIYPLHKEDRHLLRLQDIPPVLLEALQAIEDRKFQQHHGIDFRGIARAAWANLTAGRVVQGGSTLTQQLVKNFYLDSERTLTRKFNEAIMAMLLEMQYDKDEILEAYANEIYLGQDGSRAIHGFGQASLFYFGKPASELSLAESATLVAIVRGPAYYNPRRFAERVVERRNRVIDVLLKDELISEAEAQWAKQQPLKVIPRPKRSHSPYPAFVELVKQQLLQDYREEDLRSEGLRIFTSFDPEIQHQAQAALEKQLKRIRSRDEVPLQAGMVITRRGNAEVLALVGDVKPGFAGLNRALNIQRPVGSLLKPAIYLTALETDSYHLASQIPDEPVSLPQSNGAAWQPQNYDGKIHGQVSILTALSSSYNLAAVNLGLHLGMTKVVQTINKLGYKGEIPPYPSVMLGTQEMSPFEVAQIYQTLADDGFYTPLRAVREVFTQSGQPLQRYAIETEERFDPKNVVQIKFALQHGLNHGTGRRVGAKLQNESLAGKTGTTDDLRDSWFAGFGQNYVAVVWLGNDSNQVTGLTGSSGALKVWGELMKRIAPTGKAASLPLGMEMAGVDLATGLRADEGCDDYIQLPFKEDSIPTEFADCANNKSTGRSPWQGLKELFK